jgi:osmotically inducible lipoprotein OsmB
MRRSFIAITAAVLTVVTATAADARTCRRLNKTEGAAVGAVGGAILGAVVSGHGSTGPLVGAAAGGVAGHEIARTRYNRNCRYYRTHRTRSRR